MSRARGKTIDYESLKGLPESWAAEAAKHALAGNTPTRSDGGYDIATFAGGCFWGVELRFQRVPGVIATASGCAPGPQGRADLQGGLGARDGPHRSGPTHF